MNAGEIRVNHAALDQAAADMRSTVTRIDSRLNDLESELAPLKSDWSGDQQVSYQSAKATWDKAIQEMKMLLNDTQTTMLNSNQEFQSADRRGAARFGG